MNEESDRLEKEGKPKSIIFREYFELTTSGEEFLRLYRELNPEGKKSLDQLIGVADRVVA